MQQQIAPAPVPQSINTQADNDLRAQLAASLGHGGHAPVHGYGSNHHTHPQHHNDGLPASSSASPHEHSIIDPAIGGPSNQGGGGMSAGGASNIGGGSGGGGDSGGDDSMGDGSKRGGKRELSSSKRAAQNRAAQRAFRMRKEGYIKKLEEQVRDLHSLEDNYKAIQAENYSLREYIIHLQSRLIESQGDYPPAPANVNLSHPAHAHSHPHPVPVAPMAPMSIAARALREGKVEAGAGGAPAGEERTDEEIIRSQLQGGSDGLPGQM